MPKQAEADPFEKSPARPAPDRSWRPKNLGLIDAAQRLQADLKAPTTLLLIAFITLAGCSAKVEVSHESRTPAQADLEPTGPAAMEQHRTTVEIDLFGQGKSEPEAQEVPGEQPVVMPEPVPSNQGGIQVNGNENTIEFHYHRFCRSCFPVTGCAIIRHEMVILPGDGSAPVVFMDNAPPRIVLTDKELARAYAEHMLRIARQEGSR